MTSKRKVIARAFRLFLALLAAWSFPADAQAPLSSKQADLVVVGDVRDEAVTPIAGVIIALKDAEHSAISNATSDANGDFIVHIPHLGTYNIEVQNGSWHTALSSPLVLSIPRTQIRLVVGNSASVRLTVEASGSASSKLSEGLTFADQPNFVIAGITDSTSSGAHGSQSRAQTSAALAEQARSLKFATSEPASLESSPALGRETKQNESELRAAVIQSPSNFEANSRLGEFYFVRRDYPQAIPFLEAAQNLRLGDYETGYCLALAYKSQKNFKKAHDVVQTLLKREARASLHSLLADLDENLDDPLDAAREYERAVQLDPNDANFFDWGTELLIHSAISPATEVFAKGAKAYPTSGRLLIGLGIALYAGGSVEEGAAYLCQAADLQPDDLHSYGFLGEIEKTAASPLPCAEDRLRRFAQTRPQDARANYYYAIALWKRARGAANTSDVQEAEALLKRAISLDPGLADAYLQLGILYSAEEKFAQSISAYTNAIHANQRLGEAHYRLGLVYKRTGNEAKAANEFELYKKLEETETARAARRQKELRQFLIVFKDQRQAPIH